jgi:hypothetical protein
MLNQLRVYKNKVHIANIPVKGLIFGSAGVPYQAIELMRQFVKGETASQRYEQWSWEWMEVPRI